MPGEKTEELSKLEEDLKNVEERREQLELEYSAAMQTIDTKTLQRDKEAKLKVLLAKNEVSLFLHITFHWLVTHEVHMVCNRYMGAATDEFRL